MVYLYMATIKDKRWRYTGKATVSDKEPSSAPPLPFPPPLHLKTRKNKTKSTHNLCFEQTYEKYQNFLSENFYYLVVKFSVYLNRRVFVIYQNGLDDPKENENTNCSMMKYVL